MVDVLSWETFKVRLHRALLKILLLIAGRFSLDDL